MIKKTKDIYLETLNKLELLKEQQDLFFQRKIIKNLELEKWNKKR